MRLVLQWKITMRESTEMSNHLFNSCCVIGFSISLLLFNTTPVLSANSGSTTRDLSQCVREFYDPKEYNWLSFANECAEGVSIIYGVVNPVDEDADEEDSDGPTFQGAME